MSQTASYLLKTLWGSEPKFGFIFAMSLHTLPLYTSKGLILVLSSQQNILEKYTPVHSQQACNGISNIARDLCPLSTGDSAFEAK